MVAHVAAEFVSKNLDAMVKWSFWMHVEAYPLGETRLELSADI